jgi:hypothetical protein
MVVTSSTASWGSTLRTACLTAGAIARGSPDVRTTTLSAPRPNWRAGSYTSS